MNGEGTGGGGALVLLLALWVVAVFVVVGPLSNPAPAPTPEPFPSATPVPSPTPDLTFGLDCDTEEACEEPVTRAEMAGALDRALDLPPTTRNPFTDDNESEHEPAINRLAAAGLLGGCGERTFCPDETATRAQIATVLGRAFGITPGGPDAFDDDDGSIHEPAINAIAAAGITGGCGERLFCPEREVSRAALQALLQRILAEGIGAEPSPSLAPSASP